MGDIAPPIPNEPQQVAVRTKIPGPRTEELRARHDQVQDARTVHVYQDATRSLGNYLVDADGNTLLDVYGHIAALPLGYNHPAVLEAWKSGRFDWTAGYRPALGVAPPIEWVEIVERIQKVAPKGLPRLLTVTTGSEAIENAIKAAFIRFMGKRRGARPWSATDLHEVMWNRQPGVNALKVLSFEGGFHGRSLGALSLTRSKAIHKLDIPAFEWPMVPFPANRYPLEDFAKENAALEARSLQAIEDALRAWPGQIAALVVEPIQGEGGDRHASPEFFRSVQKLLRDHGAALIVDEVQTGGGATGAFWAHEHWQLPEPPDIVTFSKKMQLGGYFCRPDFLPRETYRIFNTYLGDPLRGAQLATILDTIENDRLVAHTSEIGGLLVSGLRELTAQHGEILSQARGAGTFAALDVRDAPTRDRLVDAAKQRGLECGGSGERSIRFRPALVFSSRHVAECLQILDDAAKGVR
jgi:4-aminobutyrate aminotransferase / (S)-3-amino-2-methylpropionate transaminase